MMIKKNVLFLFIDIFLSLICIAVFSAAMFRSNPDFQGLYSCIILFLFVFSGYEAKPQKTTFSNLLSVSFIFIIGILIWLSAFIFNPLTDWAIDRTQSETICVFTISTKAGG
jgi:multisubunit Na+/H+ antiporter MnhB subunit